METNTNKPLTIVFIIMIILFLLFCGGALIITLDNGGMMGSGWGSGISWMWIPALLFLTLSAILAWVLNTKKKDSEKKGSEKTYYQNKNYQP